MPGHKLFTNASSSDLMITLLVRGGDDPANSAGTIVFRLNAGQQVNQSYGSDTDSIFLNGLAVQIIQRGSPFDNLLNTNNAITFSGDGEIKITASNI